MSGKTDFQTMARQISQDGSAAQGGDLGWANPGSFVPEFEDAMNRLKEDEISMPVVSRFGVHLIQMIERHRAVLGEKDLREYARARLRDQRYAENYAEWARDLRARAFVEMRDAPR